jgi:hypothetical protein
MQARLRQPPVTPGMTIPSYGTAGQVLKSNGPNKPLSMQDLKTLTTYSGTTTNTTQVVFDVTDPTGVSGSAAVKNTGSVPMRYTFTFTDMFGDLHGEHHRRADRWRRSNV